jgi:hypothetical protein
MTKPTDPIQATHYVDNIVPVFYFLDKKTGGLYQYSTIRKEFVKTLGEVPKLIPLDNSSKSQEHIYRYLVTLTDGSEIHQDLKADIVDNAEIQKVS